MRLTRSFQPLFYALCFCLIAAIFSASINAQVKPPSELDRWKLIPRMVYPAPVNSFLSPKRLDLKELYIITAFSAPIERLPSQNEMLKNQPLVENKARPNNKIYDISSHFPNINKGDKQWVHYNLTTGQITANANTYLRTSIKEYLLRIEVVLPLVLKTTGYIVEVDIHTDSNLQKILSLIKTKSKKVQILETLKSESFTDSFVKPQKKDETKSSIITKLNREKGVIVVSAHLLRTNSEVIELSGIIVPNQTSLYECGVSRGETKQFLILTVNTMTEKGRVIDIPKTPDRVLKVKSLGMNDPTIKDNSHDPFDIGSDEMLRIEYYKAPSELIGIVGYVRPKLIITPNSQYFKSADIVYDISHEIQQSGIPVSGNIFYNRTQNEIISQLEFDHSEMFNSLLEDVSNRSIRFSNLNTKATIYEVNTRTPNNEAWNIHMIVDSAPKLICRSSFCYKLRGGSRLTSSLGEISLDNVLTATDEDVIIKNLHWNINLDSPQLKLKKSIETIIPKNGVDIVDLKYLGNGRSVIMLIETIENPYYTFKNRFQK